MIRQSHKNLFFSYRGARPYKGAINAIDRQLEDNATKALVYVLEHSQRKHVLAPFLRQIVALRASTGLERVQFALQRVDIARPSISPRIALGIAPVPGVDSRPGITRQSGRPDAWIWADDGFAILVEMKVRGAVSRQQLRRHMEERRRLECRDCTCRFAILGLRLRLFFSPSPHQQEARCYDANVGRRVHEVSPHDRSC